MSTALDAAAELIDTLAETKLLDAAGTRALDAFRSGNPDASPRDLAAFLVESGLLTKFQAESWVRGVGKQLVVGPYTITDVIGTGSMGTVFKAVSSQDGQPYAIKSIPRKNVASMDGIAAKVAALKTIRHPRVSAMIHVAAVGDKIHLVSPFLEGTKLEDVVKANGRLAPKQAAQVVQQIASGLQAYHAHELFHGLLKPSDILIGSDRRVRILDLGVGFLLTCERGKALLSTTTNSKAMAKGLDCAGPETILDPLARTVWGDQYSLGCILYFCLTGQFPFPDPNPVRKMLGHQNEQPTPVRELAPEVSPRLASVLERMMQKSPDDRYDTIDEVIAELQAVTSDPRQAAAVVASKSAAGVAARPAFVPATKAATPPPEVRRPQPAEDAAAVNPSPAASPRPERGSIPRGNLWFVLAGIAAGVAAAVLTWWFT